MDMNILKNKKVLYTFTAIMLVLVMAVSVFSPILANANVNAFASESYWQNNDNFNLSFLSSDRQIIVGNIPNADGYSSTFGLLGEYSKFENLDTISMTEEELNQVLATVKVQWYINSTMTYDNSTAFGAEQTISIKPLVNQIKSNMAIENLEVGNYYVFAVVSDGTYTLNTYIRKIEVLEDTVDTDPVVNDITVKFYATEGVVMYYNTRVGEKLSIPSAPVLENYDFVGWTINDKVVDDKTVITDTLYTLVDGVKVIKVVATYKDLAEENIKYKVTFKKFNDGWWIFDSTTQLLVKSVYKNDALPDVSTELDDNFNYYSFDKEGKEVVTEGYKVTEDITIYCNFKEDINLKTYKVSVQYYNHDNTNPVYYEKYARVFDENSILDLSDILVEVDDFTVVKYYFKYWSYDKSGLQPVKEGDTVTKDLYIYAQYTTDKKDAVDSTTLNKVEKDGFITKIISKLQVFWVEKGGLGDGIGYVLAVISLLVIVVFIGFIIVMIFKRLLR